jgi:hypothetical protein
MTAMQTLPTDLKNLITRHQQEVREALRQLRDPKRTEVKITVENGEDIVIQPLHPSKPAK